MHLLHWTGSGFTALDLSILIQKEERDEKQTRTTQNGRIQITDV